ncbi:MAG: AsmA family protein, partial [Kiloniellales bacterium]|nr:AsmA family protein [Kiloniellales bacterium]
MRLFIIVLLTVLGAVFVGLLIAPEFIDWREHRQRLAQEISQATGRAVTIDGDVAVSLLPRPVMRLEDLTVASLEGAVAPYSLQAKTLGLELRVLPFLRGQIEVSRLFLDEPQ